MKHLIRLAALLMLTLSCSAATQAATAVVAPPKVLILYDSAAGDSAEKLGFAYAIMLRNLIGHFDGDVDMAPVGTYTRGKLEGYKATFYLGTHYDLPVPPALLADMSATRKTVVWFKYNIWQLATDPVYTFPARTGLTFSTLRGLNSVPTSGNASPGFFDTVTYKGRQLVKYYAFDAVSGLVNADPDIGVMQVTDAAKATALIQIKNAKSGEQVPYITKSGKFWYFADMPFSYIGPRDRYLVLADVLHDILEIPHAENHRALVRLEDVGALVSVSAMKSLTDYLYGKRIPLSIATIPFYRDPLGEDNSGIPREVHLSHATNLKRALNYALARDGEIVMHGYTHQYNSMRNKNTAVSGDDFEFWNAAANTPVAEDSTAWARGRLQSGMFELWVNGYGVPQTWEAPHYQSSALAMKAVPPLFKTTYQRAVYYTSDTPNLTAATSKDFAVGQFFPYIITKDYYGQRILPENLGNIEYDISAIDPTSNVVYTWQDLKTNADYALVVRDGFASFFFHPFWVEKEVKKPGLADFKSIVSAISGMGYKWTSPSDLKP